MSGDRPSFVPPRVLPRGGVACTGCGSVFWGAAALMLHRRECEVIQSEIARAKARSVRALGPRAKTVRAMREGRGDAG